jgi:hypothetical protein
MTSAHCSAALVNGVPPEPPCDSENADYDFDGCKAGIELYAKCVPATCQTCINCYAVGLGINLDGRCHDNDARVMFESEGRIASCAAGAALPWEDGSVRNLCHWSPDLGPPEGWFKTVCCATCEGGDHGSYHDDDGSSYSYGASS